MTAFIEREPIPLAYTRIKRYTYLKDNYYLMQQVDLIPGEGVFVSFTGSPVVLAQTDIANILNDGTQPYEMYGFLDGKNGGLFLTDGTSDGTIQIAKEKLNGNMQQGSIMLGGSRYEYIYGRNRADIAYLEEQHEMGFSLASRRN